MLKALLWKEWRETRLFFFLMALIVPIFSLSLNNIDYVRAIKADTFAFLYVLTWVFFTVLMAANQFASEGESGTSNFLLSRPIHLINIWLFKSVYGIITLMLFGLYLLVMSKLFISPLLGAVTLLDILLQYSTNYTIFITCNGGLLFTGILGLYFMGCVVSINIKSSFKATLVTFLVSGVLFFLLMCTSSVLYFKASHYLFWIIFPVLFFIIFIKYQRVSCLNRITYWVLPLGGILIWLVISLKGGSLWVLLINLNYYRSNIIPLTILFVPVLFVICLSAISTSLFAFGILRREYPGWWKFLSCWNILLVLAICFSAFLIMITPVDQGIGPVYQLPYYWQSSNNSNLPLVVENNYSVQNRHSYITPQFNRIGIPIQHFLLNMDKGKVLFYGKDKSMPRDFQNVSADNRWIMYSYPILKWGIYYKWGLWMQNLDTSKQYLLMSMRKDQLITGKWFDEGKRLLVIKLQYGSYYRYSYGNSMLLFTVADGEPRRLGEMQIPDSNLIHIDKKSKLYFYNYRKRFVSCYNRDLVKEYDVYVIQEKFIEFKSGFKQRRKWHIYTNRPIFSPGGEFMIFNVRGYSQNNDSENKKVPRIYKNQFWYTSLPGGVSKKLNDVNLNNYYYGWRSFPWHPFADNLIIDTRISESGNKEIQLIDLNSGARKMLLREKNDNGPRFNNFAWSGNGKYFLYSSRTIHGEMTVRFYKFDLKDLSCSLVSSKANLRQPTPHLWSPERSQVVFRSGTDKEIWRLDLNTGQWFKIKCPFNEYKILGINNRGEVFVAPEGKTQIYRLTEK